MCAGLVPSSLLVRLYKRQQDWQWRWQHVLQGLTQVLTAPELNYCFATSLVGSAVFSSGMLLCVSSKLFSTLLGRFKLPELRRKPGSASRSPCKMQSFEAGCMLVM